MDGERFDRVTRAIFRRVSRRRAIFFAILGLAAARRLGEVEVSEGRGRRRQRRCRRGQRRCGGRCRNLRTDRENCGACGLVCALPGFIRCCGGRCVIPSADFRNCGACGRVCQFGESCCDGRCVDRNSDPEACGFGFECGVRCGPHAVCEAGACRCDDASGRCGGTFNHCCPLSCSCLGDGTCSC